MWTLTTSIGIGVVVSVDRRDLAGRSLCGDRVREDEPGSCQSRSVRGILLVAPLHQHDADIEREGSDEEQRDQSTCEQDEDLAALSERLGPEWLVVDDKARLRCHGDGWKRHEGDEAGVRVTGSHGHGRTAGVVPSSVGHKVAGRGRRPPAPVDRDTGSGHADGGLTDTS